MNARDVARAVALSKSTIYEMARAGKFPRPYKLTDRGGARASGWRSDEIAEWQLSRVRQRRA
jgi:prophage regulatory protein